MKVLAVLAIIAALGMSGAALALTFDQRNDDDTSETAGAARRPVLTLWRYRVDAPGHEAIRVGPGKSKTIKSSCPPGYLIVSGGENTDGPAIVTGSAHLNSRVWSREVYNATDALSTRREPVSVGAAAVCLKARGIELRDISPF